MLIDIVSKKTESEERESCVALLDLMCIYYTKIFSVESVTKYWHTKPKASR